MAPKSGTDHTDRMEKLCTCQAKELTSENLCGYILQKGSPSCGMERVRIYGKPASRPPGMVAAFIAEALMKQFPNLPVEEDGRLNDAVLRENFVERIFAYRRFRTLFGGRWTIGRPRCLPHP